MFPNVNSRIKNKLIKWGMNDTSKEEFFDRIYMGKLLSSQPEDNSTIRYAHDLNQVIQLNKTNLNWQILKENTLPGRIGEHQNVCIGSRLLIFGGRDRDSSKVSDAIWVFYVNYSHFEKTNSML